VSIPATGYFFAWVRRQARATAAELILAVAVGTVVAAVAIGFLFLPLTAAPVSVRTVLKPCGTSPTRQSHRTPGPCGHRCSLSVGAMGKKGQAAHAGFRRLRKWGGFWSDAADDPGPPPLGGEAFPRCP
jgi:hypothetical protein